MLVAYSCWLRRLGYLRDIWSKHTYRDLMPYDSKRIYSCDSINGCCFLIKQEFLERIGYLDEGTFLYAEELILALQIRAGGFHCLFHAGKRVRHHQGASSGQHSKRVFWRLIREDIKSQLYLCEKYLGCSKLQRAVLQGVRMVDFLMRKAQMLFFELAGFLNFRRLGLSPRTTESTFGGCEDPR